MKKSTLQRPFSINLAAKATIFALTTLCALEHAMADESKQFDNFESYAGTGYDQPHRPLRWVSGISFLRMASAVPVIG